MQHMERKSSVLISFLQSLLISYLFTGACLLLLALLLYRFQLAETVVSVAIILIYILSTFLAGFIIGKKKRTKKFFWGFVIGISYFVVMLIVSLLINHSIEDVSTNLLTTFLLCSGAGMLGGMLS